MVAMPMSAAGASCRWHTAGADREGGAFRAARALAVAHTNRGDHRPAGDRGRAPSNCRSTAPLWNSHARDMDARPPEGPAPFQRPAARPGAGALRCCVGPPPVGGGRGRRAAQGRSTSS